MRPFCYKNKHTW